MPELIRVISFLLQDVIVRDKSHAPVSDPNDKEIPLLQSLFEVEAGEDYLNLHTVAANKPLPRLLSL